MSRKLVEKVGDVSHGPTLLPGSCKCDLPSIVRSQSVFVAQSELLRSIGVGPSWAQLGVRTGVGGHMGDFWGVTLFLLKLFLLLVSNADWSGSGRLDDNDL